MHKAWVRELATRLRADGINVHLDHWDTVPGDQLPQFMERKSFRLLVVDAELISRRRPGVPWCDPDRDEARWVCLRDNRPILTGDRACSRVTETSTDRGAGCPTEAS